ncbi:hypothetical protein BDB00DRAFT_306373 [Zychaea mexicana]|uniref:uncharacterized protein n=1 Tax=Zychaea mexicana TaxID=64656 RepID=UPI0022FF214D|nr:uncharacterized protein BDB00DRAFT_306373 [Zychaea mexicana]KAI9494497.1 hypothetical protein BDB00DRAFT_306373 [Zychaea mexicana]
MKFGLVDSEVDRYVSRRAMLIGCYFSCTPDCILPRSPSLEHEKRRLSSTITSFSALLLNETTHFHLSYMLVSSSLSICIIPA